MFNFPPFFYVKKFWEALSLLVAGVSGLLYVLGVLPIEYLVGSAAVLSFFLSILRLVGVDPKVFGFRARTQLKTVAKKSQPKSKK